MIACEPERSKCAIDLIPEHMHHSFMEQNIFKVLKRNYREFSDTWIEYTLSSSQHQINYNTNISSRELIRERE